MSKLPHGLSPAVALSKLDTRDWTRALWREAFAMARRMVRDRRTSTAAGAWSWYLDAARKRFGASGWKIAQAAGRVVFDRRTTTHARTGSAAELHRQGMVTNTRRVCEGSALAVVPTRGVAVERFVGSLLVWTADPLASGANHGLRVQQAKRLREERAAVLAQLEAEGRYYPLTEKGYAALVAAEMAADRVALAAGGALALA